MKTQTKEITQELEVIGVSKETSITIKKTLQPFYEQAKEWQEKAEGLNVTDISQVEEMAQAREARIALKNIRTALENKRKELKEESLKTGQAIDSTAKEIKDLITPIESHLKEQEDFAKNEEIKRKKKLKEDRELELNKYDVDGSFYQLEDMPEENYAQLLENSIVSFKAKKDEEERLENERIENQRLDALEEERRTRILPLQRYVSQSVYQELRTMSDEGFESLLITLSKEEENEKIEQEKIRKENQRLKKEAEKAEKKRLAEEKKRAEEEAKRLAEIKKKEAENEAKLKEERLAREKAEKEIADQKEKERLLKIAEQKKQDELAKAKKKELLAPDKEKMKKLAETIVSIKMPEVSSEESKAVLNSVKNLLNKTTSYLNEKIDTL